MRHPLTVHAARSLPIALALVLVAPVRPPAAVQDRAVAFVDVTVVPFDAEYLLEHHTVIVSDGVIRAVGPSSDIDVPADAVIVDGRNRYLMPGLADMHVHLTGTVFWPVRYHVRR